MAVLSPLKIKFALFNLQKSIVNPEYESTLIFGSSANIFFIIFILFSNVKKPFFAELYPMATIILSNKGNALFTTDSCPIVKGSKEPGNKAVFFIKIIFNNECITNFQVVKISKQTY